MNARIFTAIALGALSLDAAAQADIAAAVEPGEPGWGAWVAELDISGATASDGATESVFFAKEANGGVCQDGTLVFLISAGDENVTYSCNVNGTSGTTLFPGLQAGDLIRASKNSLGGSATGCFPVANQTTEQFIPTAEADLVPVGGAGKCQTRVEVDNGPADQDADRVEFRGCPENDLRAPDAGFSDIECAQFGLPASAPVTTFPGFQIIFGFPVSVNIYRGLQACQGLTVGSDDVADAPTLPEGVIASMYSGLLTDWDQLDCDADGDGVSDGTVESYTESVNGISLAGNGAMYLQRRVETSGTQTFTEIWSLRENCTPNAPVFLNSNTPGNSCATSGSTDCEAQIAGGTVGTVCCNSGSGNVRQSLFACDQNDYGCFGVLSLDSSDDFFTTTGSDADEDGRFVKVDGRYPTLCNAMDGQYDFVSLNTGQVFNDEVGNPLAGLISSINTPEAVAVTNAGINDVTFPAINEYTGFVADPITGFSAGFFPAAPACFTDQADADSGSPDPKNAVAFPTGRHTRASTFIVNNCSAYTNFFNAVTVRAPSAD